jgi:hypothetical protein
MKRIAPQSGISHHFDAIIYLNELSIQWKLRRTGEPHTLTLALLGEWRGWRVGILACKNDVNVWSYLGERSFAMAMKISKHAYAVQQIDQLVLNLEAEYGWPAPLQPLVNEDDIKQLRGLIREFEQCRDNTEVKY